MICSFIFFFNDTATTEIYTLSLHDALPIFQPRSGPSMIPKTDPATPTRDNRPPTTSRRGRSGSTERGTKRDRKSTRLNSSHANISYAVFCLKKKKKKHDYT